jgi:hypothetical protein
MVKFALIILSIPILIATTFMLVLALLLGYIIKKTGVFKYLPYFKRRHFSPSLNRHSTSTASSTVSQTAESTELLVPCPRCGVYISQADFDSHQASHR